MSSSGAARPILCFAELLSYPNAGLVQLSRDAQMIVAPYDDAAAEVLGQFRSLVEAIPASRLEEIYTATFDLDPMCHLYLGAHLFGESYQRSAFLVKLKELYRNYDLPDSAELPDHLAMALRFLAVCPDAELTTELVREAILPVLAKMGNGEAPPDPPDPAVSVDGEEPAAKENRAPSPYGYVIQALGHLLEKMYPPAARVAGGNHHA